MIRVGQETRDNILKVFFFFFKKNYFSFKVHRILELTVKLNLKI